MEERMLPPCAVMSGLSPRLGVGPQEEKSEMKGPEVCFELILSFPESFFASISPSS